MTTQVTITKTDKSNHHDVMVDCVDKDPDGDVRESHRLKDGESVTLCVYDTRELVVREVEKE